jgi:hypothetical protein
LELEEFNRGDLKRAISYFTEARGLDPSLVNAQWYLGTAYAASYVPTDTSVSNRANGEATLTEFRDELVHDSRNLSALDGLGSLRFQMAGSLFNRETFLESKTCFRLTLTASFGPASTRKKSDRYHRISANNILVKTER